jgi:hypothetical protein
VTREFLHHDRERQMHSAQVEREEENKGRIDRVKVNENIGIQKKAHP